MRLRARCVSFLTDYLFDDHTATRIKLRPLAAMNCTRFTLRYIARNAKSARQKINLSAVASEIRGTKTDAIILPLLISMHELPRRKSSLKRTAKMMKETPKNVDRDK